MAPRRSQNTTAEARAEKARGKRPVNAGSSREVNQEVALAVVAVSERREQLEIDPSVAVCNALRKAHFRSTRFPDMDMLKELGIHDEVQEVFKNMGLHKLFNMARDSYHLLTCHFLASLEVTFYEQGEAGDPYFGDGFIKFQIERTIHTVGFNKLNEVFGFAKGRVRGSDFEFEEGELSRIWTAIAAGPWKAGKSKASCIKHPALRFAHRYLAEVFFGKKEYGYVAEDELELLALGVIPILNQGGMWGQFKGARKKIGPLVVLLKHLLHYQGWIMATKDKRPVIGIGGIVAHILEATRDRMGHPSHFVEVLGVNALSKSQFLVGKVENGYVYQYHITFKEKALLVLPSPQFTNFRELRNIQFDIPKEALFDPLTHAPAEPLTQRSFQPSAREVALEVEDSEEREAASPPKFGSARYYFEVNDGASPQVALKQANQHLKLLQRWNKWQDKTIKNLVKTVKSMKSQIKELKSKVGGSSTSRRRGQAAEEEEEVDSAMDADQRRHSFHEVPREMPQAEAPRASSHERRPRRKRRATHTPSPQSSNMSYSLDTSYSSSSVQF